MGGLIILVGIIMILHALYIELHVYGLLLDLLDQTRTGVHLDPLIVH